MPSLVTSLVLLLVAARTGWFPAGGLPDLPAAAALLSRPFTAGALSLPAVARPCAADCRLARTSAVARDSRGARRALHRCGRSRAASRGQRVDLAARASPVAEAGARDLRHHHRLGAQRIVRRRDRDVLARAWRPDVPGAAGARPVSCRGLRRHRILRPRSRHPRCRIWRLPPSIPASRNRPDVAHHARRIVCLAAHRAAITLAALGCRPARSRAVSLPISATRRRCVRISIDGGRAGTVRSSIR